MWDFMSESRWKIDWLTQVLPKEIVGRICSIHTSFETQKLDRSIWDLSKSGEFLLNLLIYPFFMRQILWLGLGI